VEKRKNFFFLFIILILSSNILLQNLSLNIFGGDSAEYATTSTIWGIPHPPGYPLYSLITNFVNHSLPFTNIYLKISLISAFFTLLSSFLLFNLFLLLRINLIIAFLSTVFFITLFPVWLYSIVPEVFSFAVFLILAQIYCLIHLTKKQNKKIKYLFILSLGIALAHHHFFLFFVPSYIFLIIRNKTLKKFFLEEKVKSFFFLFVPLVFYLYFPIVSYFFRYPDIENTTTIEGLLRMILRSSYGTFKAYAYISPNPINRVFDFFSPYIFVFHDFKLLGFFFIITGFLYLILFNNRRDKDLSVFFLTNIFFVNFFFFYANFFLRNTFSLATQERFLIFFYLVLIFYFVYGANFILLLINKWVKKLTDKKIILVLSKSIVYIFLVTLIIKNYTSYLPLITTVKNNDLFENYGRSLLNYLPENSILFLASDNGFFLTQHYQKVFNLRKDVVLLTYYYLDRNHLREYLKSYYSNILIPNTKNNLEDFLLANYKKGRPIFSEQPLVSGEWLPYGLVWKYYPNKKELEKDKQEIIKKNNQLWSQYKLPKITTQQKNILFINSLQDFYATRLIVYINYLLEEKQDRKAISLLNKYYDYFANNQNFNYEYLLAKMKERQCDRTSQKLASFLERNIKTEEKNYYLILGIYYDYCKEDKAKADYFYDNFKKIKEREESF
jgi:hypothetical protein